jgi:hypothetical protein
MTKTNRHIFMLATAAAFLAAVLFASTSPALAGDHGRHGRGHHKGHGHNKHHQSASHHYTVPQVLTPTYRGAFKPYYKGRVYYAPHNHYHASYRLPVYYGGAVAYRPYAYCEDHLFVSGNVALPQLAFSFNFGSPGGFYAGGYYPAPPPVYYEDHHHHHDCNH